MSQRFTLPERPSVVITGASSGIGEACAYRFATTGARMALLARRAARLEQVAERARSLGGDAHVVPVDLASAEQATRAVERAESALGDVDVLVNNAGFGLYAPIESVPREDLERMFAVNTFAPVVAMQTVLPGMRRRGRGVIINVSSVVGKRALPMTGAYGASKYALHGFSDALRVELRDTGVHVSVVCPGFTRTEFSDNVVDYGVERGRPSGGAMSAEAVAETIVDCAHNPRAEILLTGKGKTLAWLQRISPKLADWALARNINVRLPPMEPSR